MSSPNRPAGQSGAPTTITSIPLTDVHVPGDGSIGNLVKDATVQMSTLVRAEVALAKAEVTSEVKKGLIGSVFFIVALVILLFSTFYFFFFLAEMLNIWLPRWAAFLIVFGAMLLTAVVFAGLGVWRVTKIRAPQKTIESLKQASSVLPSGADHSSDGDRFAKRLGTGG